MKQQVLKEGFTRVERDDRLLDVLPTQTREKGIELWEKWSPQTVEIIRIRLPYDGKKECFILKRDDIENSLYKNKSVKIPF